MCQLMLKLAVLAPVKKKRAGEDISPTQSPQGYASHTVPFLFHGKQG